MPNAIKELSKLTCRAKPIDGTSFGGGLPEDVMEVSAVLGMCNADTGKPLNRHAYNFARFAYCADMQARAYVRAQLLNVMLKEDTGKLSDVIVLKIVLTAMREFVKPQTNLDDKGVQQIKSYTNYRIAKHLNIKPQSLTAKHKKLYSKVSESILMWNSEAIQHINSHYRDETLEINILQT